jgi:hypothetical protein
MRMSSAAGAANRIVPDRLSGEPIQFCEERTSPGRRSLAADAVEQNAADLPQP